MRLTLMRESWILIAIGVSDLAVTLVCLADPGVREGNPLMKYYLDIGVGAFVAVKMLLLFMPLFVAEYSRQFRPVFVRFMLRFAIGAYVGTYAILFAGLNLRPIAMSMVSASEPTRAVAKAPDVPQHYVGLR
jgi:hypothetical protein